MDALLSTDGLNELQDTWRRFDLHYAGARPWGEFFEQFKPTARDLDTRMATNWLHYKANYAQLTTLVVALGLLVAHISFCSVRGSNSVDGVRDGLPRPPHPYDRQL